MWQGFSNFSGFLHHFVLIELVTVNIRVKNNVMARVFNNQLYKDISGKTDGYFHNCSILFKINIHVRSRSSVALNMHLCNNVFSENRWDFVYLF